MKILTLEEQRRRLCNLRFAQQQVKKAVKTHRIRDYLPAQVTYNLGSYPVRFSIMPTEYDENLIRSLSEKGVQLIQIHEEWNDSIRHLGADKFSSHDPRGMHAFIDLCHKHNIKVIPYISSGFFDDRDPDFRPEFAKYELNLNQEYYRYRLCSLESPEWSSYLYEKVHRILDTYDFDGLYNDMGYDELAYRTWHCDSEAERQRAIGESYNPCAEDMLARLYELAKGQGKLIKVHLSGATPPPFKEKIYDYLWVGESVKNPDVLRNTASFEPYVVPCPDFMATEAKSFERFFALFLPMMQFPLRADGRPITAAGKFSVPGVEYASDTVATHWKEMEKYAAEHPDGPHCYSEWSSIPDDVNYRERWFDYLALYKPMVQEGTVAYVDVREAAFLKQQPGSGVSMSLFAGDELYLCVGNTGSTPEQLVFCQDWVDRETGEKLHQTTLQPDKVRFFRLDL